MQTNILPRKTYSVWVMALLFGLLIGANTLIKILRDSVFLGHHSVSELPYLYILVAFIAGVIITTYTRYTAKISIIRLILSTNAVILSNIIFFWVLLTYYDPGWSHYAFYIWSAMATVIAVAQTWTLANHIFTQEEAKRSFGLIAAGGTVGGVAASFGAKWSIHLSVESNHLLWVVGGIYIIASVLVMCAQNRLNEKPFEVEGCETKTSETAEPSGIGALLSGSGYFKTIALIILASVIVSTLIDFSFKTEAKQANSSTRELALFFASYYGWLNAATLFVQVLLTGKTLKQVGASAKPLRHSWPIAYRFGSHDHVAGSADVYAHADGGRDPTQQYSSQWDGNYLYGRTPEYRENSQDLCRCRCRKGRRRKRRIHHSPVQSSFSGAIHRLRSFYLPGTDL